MKDNNETNEKKDMGEHKEKAFGGNETSKEDKKVKKGVRGKRKRWNGEKKFYLFTAVGCAVILLAVILVAALVTDSGSNQQAIIPPVGSGEVSSGTSDSGDGSDSSGDEPVITLPEGMIAPVASVTVGNDYGFHQSQTLGWYFVHEGVDFTAAVGSEVFAAEDGVVESVYKDDLLLGTEIVLSHGDGLKTLYRFVNETDGLTVGKSVKKGDVIATVAEPTGNEYKDGAHLHFEVLEKGKSVDPTKYLTLEEK